jgi:hypothetical protein
MDLQINGEVIQVLEEQSGEGRNGPWRKQEFILETRDQYPKQIFVVQWGDKIDEFSVLEGEVLNVHIDIQSRECKGRGYTDVKAWRVDREGSAPDPGPPIDYPTDPQPSAGPGMDDDLPF